MKKTITITVIVILLLNLISIKSFAEDEVFDLTPQETGTQELVPDGPKEGDEEGKPILTNITGTTYSNAGLFKTVAKVLTIIPQATNQLLESFVEVTTDGNMDRFTIYDTVMGHYDIFNIDYLNVPRALESTDGDTIIDATLMEQIKYNVIKYYTIIRNLSIAISLFVLIYIGIRMAISTVVNDRAKYKKMLVSWVASLILVFFMHFIVIVISVLLKYGLGIIESIAGAWGVQEFEQEFESEIYSITTNNLKVNGFNVFSTLVLIYLLAWFQVKFFIYYMRRTLEVNFLIIVSPLVTITYSIDKAGDGKAQAFQAFLKELIMKSVIQIVHAMLYVVFIASAGVIASSQPILAIFFFMALSRSEKIVRKIFTINEDGFQKTKIPTNLPFLK